MSNIKNIVSILPQRHVLTLMLFLGFINAVMMRSGFLMALTQMVEPKTNSENVAVDKYTCPLPAADVTEHAINITDAVLLPTTDDNVKYAWSEELQGFILGSFYIGYVLMHIPGGLIAERIGGKSIIFVAIFCTGLLTLITPITIFLTGAPGLIVLRILIGSIQGGVYPAVTVIMSQWVPSRERTRLGSIIFCGVPIGNIIGHFVGGLLLHYYQNWYTIFYYFGISGIVFGALFGLICTSSPQSHPFITEAELIYLEKEIGQLQRNTNLRSTPWKSILTSGPVIALSISWCLGDFANVVMLIDLPKYINDVLHASILENGIYTSIPFIMTIFVAFSAGSCSDWLITTRRMSVTNVRKLFMGLFAGTIAIFIMAASYAGCNAWLVTFFFTIAIGAQGFEIASNLINPMDLSPNYSGTIAGITNGIGSCTGIVVPWVVGLLTPNSLATEWRAVFWMTFFLLVAEIIIFTTWGSGDVQKWNDQEEETEVNEVNNKNNRHDAN